VSRLPCTMKLVIASVFTSCLSMREFPELAHVIHSICGVTEMDFSMQHPCQHTIFTIGFAFTDCGDRYETDSDAFKSCVRSCAPPSPCQHACSDPLVQSPNCFRNCKAMMTCVATSLANTTGRVSAKDHMVDCFEADHTSEVALSVAASPGPAHAPAPALIPLTAFVDRGALPAPSPSQVVPLAPSPAVVSVASSPGSSTEVAVNAKVFDSALAPNGCSCSKDGLIRGIQTGHPGCGKYGTEPNAVSEAFCYIEGDFNCAGAMPSAEHEGLFWINCEMLNLAAVYPPTCEILHLAENPLFQIPSSLGLDTPGNLVKPLPLVPGGLAFDSLLDALNPPHLDNAWHAQRDNEFVTGPYQHVAAPSPVAVQASSPGLSPFALQPIGKIQAPAPAYMTIAALSQTPSRIQLRGSGVADRYMSSPRLQISK